MKGFSIIIPTLNRTAFLLETLKYLVVQEFEFPVIDFSLVHKDIVDYHHITSFRGLPEARNYGASKAIYDYILYLDDDVECGKTLLKEHYSCLKEEDVGVVAGGVTEKNNPDVGDNIGIFKQFIAQPITGFHNDKKRYVDHAKGCNFSVKKSVFLELNGIDTILTKGAALYEELDFCLRLRKINLKVFFNYQAHVYHLAAATGGCRVPKIDKYIFSLVRNRTIIINRHLPWYCKLTARLYLFKLVLSYFVSYKEYAIIKNYYKGIKEGRRSEKTL